MPSLPSNQKSIRVLQIALLIITFLLAQKSWTQSINVSPSSLNIQPCSDSISLSVTLIAPPASSDYLRVTIPGNSYWTYMDLSASVTGSAVIDSVVNNDSTHVYLSNVTNNTLTLYMESGCEAINSSSYNFSQQISGTYYLTAGGSSTVSASTYVTVNSPFLVVAPRNYPNNPSIGDTIIRQTIIRNTGSLPFSGDFRFSYTSQLYAEVIGTDIRSTSDMQLYSSTASSYNGLSKGNISDFSTSDSLIFTDTIVLTSCLVDSTQTTYTFNYGCDSTNLCQNIGITPFLYSNIVDKSAHIVSYIEELDRSCFLSKDTMTVRFGVTNVDNIPARDFMLRVNKLINNTDYGKAPYIPSGGLKIYYNNQLVNPDSITFTTNTCAEDSAISYAAKHIAKFEPGDSLLFEYKTLNCCGTSNYQYVYYDIYASSEKQCVEGSFVHKNIRKTKVYEIEQFFENLTATIQIAPGDLDRTSDPVEFNIENTEALFLDAVPPRDENGLMQSPYYQLLGNDKSAIFEVKIALDTGLKYVDSTIYMKTLPNAAFQYTWYPYEVYKILGPNSLHGDGGMKDTIIARFSLADFFYEKRIINNSWRYDTLEYFFSDSKVYFDLQGICPAKQPKTTIEETISLIPDTNCIDQCRVEIVKAEAEVAVMCPGCETPGYITSVFSLNRSTIGLKDNDNNHYPDFPNLNVKADKDSISIKRAIIGDTLDVYLKARLWEGAIKVSNLGFDMKNTIVQFLLADQLDIVGDLTCVYNDVSESKIDTVTIPSSYLTYNGSVLDFHIDSLEANGFITPGQLNYFGGFDEFEVFGKVRVNENIADAQQVVLSMSRVYGSGLIFPAGVDAGDQYANGLPLDSSNKYWCEFQGDMTSLVRVEAAPYVGPANNGNLLTKKFESVYSHIVSSSQYITFLNSKYPIEIGKNLDDSFPFEYRKFVEFDSVIIGKPDNYVLKNYDIRKKASSHDGSLNFFYSIMNKVENPPLDVASNSYITLPQSHFSDTTHQPDFNDPKDPSYRNVFRNNKVFNTDEETHPVITYEITPTNCAAIIGKKIPFSFKGMLKSYPLQEGPITIYEDTLEAYLPEVKLTTEVTSVDTIYLTDTVHSSSFRLINDASKNPIVEGYNPHNVPYLVDLFENVFARVIGTPSVQNIGIKIAGSTHSSQVMPYDAAKDLFELKDVRRGAPSIEYEVFYSYACPSGVQNVTDSVLVITGWNCNGYPSDLATACQLDTNVFYIVPQSAGLDGVLTRVDTSSTCDTVSYELSLNSQGSGKMLNIRTQLDLSLTDYTYIAGSAELDFQGSTYPITPDVNGYFNLDDIVFFNDNGFSYNNGEAVFRFYLAGEYSGLTETIKLNIDGESYCGDYISFIKQIDITPCEDESIYFKTTWQVGVLDPNDATVTIPTIGGGYNYNVDWGDGTVSTNVSGSAFHDYSLQTGYSPGNYVIKISGDFPRIYFQNASTAERQKILSIDQWGNIEWTSFALAFKGCSNLNELATDAPDLSNVTSLALMFDGASSLNGNLSNWDVSNITSIYGMFFGATSFNNGETTNTGSQPLSWGSNTSNMTNIARAFFGCSSFNQSINDWNISSVTDMSLLFRGALVFNQPLNNWNSDMVSVKNTGQMFYQARKFNQDIGDWDVSNVTNMSLMFYAAPDFNQDLSDWDVSRVKTMYHMFLSAGKFNNGDPENVSNTPLTWDVDSVTDMKSMFAYCYIFNQDISSWNTSSVTNMSSMFNKAFDFNQDISGWDISSVITINSMFFHASNFDYSLGGWDIGNIINMDYLLETSAMSVANYDNTLIGWEAYVTDPLNAGKPIISATNKNIRSYGLTYCSAATERANLINNYGWVIDYDNMCSPRLKSDNFGQASEPFKVINNNGSLQIRTSINSDETYDLLLFNANGQLLYQKYSNNGNMNIPVSDFSSGVYFLRFQYGGKIETKKVAIVNQ